MKQDDVRGYNEFYKQQDLEKQRKEDFIIKQGEKTLSSAPSDKIYVIVKYGVLERKATPSDFSGWISNFVELMEKEKYIEIMTKRIKGDLF